MHHGLAHYVKEGGQAWCLPVTGVDTFPLFFVLNLRLPKTNPSHAGGLSLSLGNLNVVVNL